MLVTNQTTADIYFGPLHLGAGIGTTLTVDDTSATSLYLTSDAVADALNNAWHSNKITVSGEAQPFPRPTGVPELLHGDGAPEGLVFAPEGSLYMRRDGSGSDNLYTKTTGVTINTGWSVITSLSLDALSAICQGRLTLTSGTPVTTSDVTGATTIYFTPYKGDGIALYLAATSDWSMISFSETSLALGTLTSGLPYDVFAYNNGGVLALEIDAWANATTRTTALALQSGVLVKSGDATRRYLGSFYTTSATTTEDSAQKRYLWNYYNRVRKKLLRLESTLSWTLPVDTTQQAHASSLNQVELVQGWPESVMDLDLRAWMSCSVGNIRMLAGIAEDSTSSFNLNTTDPMTPSYTSPAGAEVPLFHTVRRVPAVGRHVYAWLENTHSATTTAYGNINGDGCYTGLTGAWEC